MDSRVERHYTKHSAPCRCPASCNDKRWNVTRPVFYTLRKLPLFRYRYNFFPLLNGSTVLRPRMYFRFITTRVYSWVTFVVHTGLSYDHRLHTGYVVGGWAQVYACFGKLVRQCCDDVRY